MGRKFDSGHFDFRKASGERGITNGTGKTGGGGGGRGGDATKKDSKKRLSLRKDKFDKKDFSSAKDPHLVADNEGVYGFHEGNGTFFNRTVLGTQEDAKGFFYQQIKDGDSQFGDIVYKEDGRAVYIYKLPNGATVNLRLWDDDSSVVSVVGIPPDAKRKIPSQRIHFSKGHKK